MTVNQSDHDRLLLVCQQWQRMYGELFVKAQHLTIERDAALAEIEDLKSTQPKDDHGTP